MDSGKRGKLPVDEDDVAAGKKGVAFGDGEAEPHAVFLESDRRLEQRGGGFAAQPRAGIVDFYGDRAVARARVREYGAANTCRFGGILQQIRDDALHQVGSREEAARPAL